MPGSFAALMFHLRCHLLRSFPEWMKVAQLCPTLCNSMVCPWISPGKNTGVGCHSPLQGIFLTQGSNPSLLHCRQILYHLSYREFPDHLSELYILSSTSSYSLFSYKLPYFHFLTGLKSISNYAIVCLLSISHSRLWIRWVQRPDLLCISLCRSGSNN